MMEHKRKYQMSESSTLGLGKMMWIVGHVDKLSKHNPSYTLNLICAPTHQLVTFHAHMESSLRVILPTANYCAKVLMSPTPRHPLDKPDSDFIINWLQSGMCSNRRATGTLIIIDIVFFGPPNPANLPITGSSGDGFLGFPEGVGTLAGWEDKH